MPEFLRRIFGLSMPPAMSELLPPAMADKQSRALRSSIKRKAGVLCMRHGQESEKALLAELRYVLRNAATVSEDMRRMRGKRVLFSGQSYYHGWNVSRALRTHGWKADLLNWDLSETSQIYYHGEDIRFTHTDGTAYDTLHDLRFYVAALYQYDVFHFANAHGICFGFPLQNFFSTHFGMHSEIHLLKALGKKIVYSLSGCQDGVSQTAFSQWGPDSICAICRWRDFPDVCSDARNLAWGKFRNEVADYICTTGGNRVDYNLARHVHEVPEFFCVESRLWDPTLAIPSAFKLPVFPDGTVQLYHAVGNRAERTDEHGVNIKSTHIYLPLIKKLQAEGLALNLLEPTGVPNIDIRFIQMQADIFLDMLTYGWFGANAREAMMLGKPVICYLRPEWLEDLRRELPEYAAELPIISATPDTIEAILRDLIAHPEKRRAIGNKSRAFALKWHSSEAGAARFDSVYSDLLHDNPLLLGPNA